VHVNLGALRISALHLNIPSKDETKKQYWLRRVKWAVCGVLIPEIVALLGDNGLHQDHSRMRPTDIRGSGVWVSTVKAHFEIEA